MTTTTTTNNKGIYMATLSAGTNIAVIKYWGKDSLEYNTPINDSLSVTLDQSDLRAITTVAASTQFTNDRLWLNGTEDLSAASNKRFRACVDGVKALATTKTFGTTTLTLDDWKAMKIHVSSYNTFPTAAGLASSAAGYAALVASLAHLMNAQESYPGQLSTIARQGSGSACRSLYGGVVAWRKGSAQKNWQDSMAEPIRETWPELRALICVVSDLKKDTSSTAGMVTSVNTSKLLEHRARSVVPQRMVDIIQAIQSNDFETFGKITMQDSNQFHAVCLDTYPPIFYMNDISKSIIALITIYNEYYQQIRAAYTFDAGPNAVLYTLESYEKEVGALILRYYPEHGNQYVNNADYSTSIQSFPLEAGLVEACDAKVSVQTPGRVKKLYYTKAGPGPQVVTDICNLDPETGLNCYTP